MSKRQKGRRHRRVNRTPRPVGGGSSRPKARWGARQEGRAESRQEGGVEARADARVEARGEGRVEAQAEARGVGGADARVEALVEPRSEAGAGAPAAAGADVPSPAGPRARPAAVPGLGRHEARTWDGLRSRGADGASVDDLCASVGYQPRTILKHVAGLAGHGLAERRGDRWYARTGEEALAGAQGG
ncbi:MULTISPECIES: hypothetical protein [Streptomyces]|uniref:hypothetical protein n=1 Tax=Streptomyces TaxID=1883 RepID=UPI00163CB52B|nr:MULTISPECIES: hypothetical protein [Streptomyces]MBC2879590.1 hypothetical protein [Streptomyces sp. TYQ1024]UBI40138.1 hypothetical protein K7I03_29225 [Streptomyces mobaraensis]UKW32717.1 hypothetical protein MCU78_29155 [Streptomyces sp. TYQ1024]